MADIWCKVCGEPWDVDSLHDAVDDGRAESWQHARQIFGRVGCRLWGAPHADGGIGGVRASIADALGDLLGDDVDGLAAMLEDVESGHGGAGWLS